MGRRDAESIRHPGREERQRRGMNPRVRGTPRAVDGECRKDADDHHPDVRRGSEEPAHDDREERQRKERHGRRRR